MLPTELLPEPEQLHDAAWMQRALDAARAAEAEGEVPVGAVLVLPDGQHFVGHNRPIAQHDPTAHAEVQALRAAAAAVGNYRLTGATLYVTLEPCIMCAGAILHARVQRLVYAADDPRAGAVHSCYPIFKAPKLNHATRYTAGVMAEESAALLRAFFKARRG